MGPLNAHPSAVKMLYALKKVVGWKGITQDTMDFVNRCGTCQLNRPGAHDKPGVKSRGEILYPMQRISLDILSLEHIPGGAAPYVLVIMDEFTKYTEAYPIRHQDAQTVADRLVKHFITRYGIPQEIITDRGGCFMGKVFQRICQQLKVKKISTTAYHPQGNGANERVHQTLYGILRNLTENHGIDWEKKLPYALFAYNNSFHRSIQRTPHEALYGYATRHVDLEWEGNIEQLELDERVEALKTIHMEVSKVLKGQEDQRNKVANKKSKERIFSPGEFVKVYRNVRNKLEPYWVGPYQVIRQTGPATYEIDLGEESQRHPVINVAQIRPWLFYQDIPNLPEEKEMEKEKPGKNDISPEQGVDESSDKEIKGPMTRARVKKLGVMLMPKLP
jgi:hypothetical protein